MATKPKKPACVTEVEQGANLTLEGTWARLKGRAKLSAADMDLWITACREDRARWVIKERKKAEG